jgi:hypothetical protein
VVVGAAACVRARPGQPALSQVLDQLTGLVGLDLARRPDQVRAHRGGLRR